MEKQWKELDLDWFRYIEFTYVFKEVLYCLIDDVCYLKLIDSDGRVTECEFIYRYKEKMNGAFDFLSNHSKYSESLKGVRKQLGDYYRVHDSIRKKYEKMIEVEQKELHDFLKIELNLPKD